MEQYFYEDFRLSAEDFSDEFTAVKDNGSGKLVKCTADTDACLGIAVGVSKSGDRIKVARMGIVRVKVTGTPANETEICPDDATAGQVKGITGSASEVVIGKLLETGVSGAYKYAMIYGSKDRVS